MRSVMPGRLRPVLSAALTRASSLLPALVFALITCRAGAPPAPAQVRPPDLNQSQERRQRPRRAEGPSPFDAPGEGESEGGADEEETRPPAADPASVLRAAKTVCVRSKSAFVSGREVEDSLRKRKEVRAWGLVVTRDEAGADLIIEVTRKSFTRRYTFTVLDPRTMTVVASGKTRSVLFGKKIANKIAEKFANRVRAVRPYPPSPGTP